MAIDDFEGEPVLGGMWLYDGATPRRVLIVACNFDRELARSMDETPYTGDALTDLPPPKALGSDGCLYHVRGTDCPDLASLEEARAWADSQPWGPVTWDNHPHRG